MAVCTSAESLRLLVIRVFSCSMARPKYSNPAASPSRTAAPTTSTMRVYTRAHSSVSRDGGGGACVAVDGPAY